MRNIFKEKIIECREIAKAMLLEHFNPENNAEQKLLLYNFLDKGKINGNQTFQELWDSYGFTTKNLALLNLSTIDKTTNFHASYKLMEKWVEILFKGKLKFKDFFDIEIEAHNKLRKKAAKKGMHRLNLTVNFSNIAVYIDQECGATPLPEIVYTEERNAVFKFHYAAVSDKDLVAVLNSISLENLCTGKNGIIVKWMKNAEGFPDQLISEKLKSLHFFINSIDVSIATGKNYPIMIHLRVLRSKLEVEMYKTLELIEWLFEGKSEGLEPEFEDLIRFCNEKYQ
jgi:hypothetical protein